MKLLNCKSDGCENFCKAPSTYCGHCAGYAHEMTVSERQTMLKGMLLTVAIAGAFHNRFKPKRKKSRRSAGKGAGE